MSHPFNSLRNDKVQKSRVSSITAACGGGMATGGAVSGSKTIARKDGGAVSLRADGGAVKSRADRPNRARGGRTKKSGKGHTVNVIVAPSAPKPPMPPMIPGVAAGSPGLSPPRPPLTPPAGGPIAAPGAAPPLGAGPMPPPGALPPPGVHYAGGRAYKKGGRVKSAGGAAGGKSNFSGTPMKAAFTTKGKPADGGKGNHETGDTAGIGKGRTPIQSIGTNKMDTKNIGRGPVITKATGGPINSDYAWKKGMAPHAKGGAMGGLAKLDKADHPSKYVRG